MANQLDDKNNTIAKMRTEEAITKEHLYNLSADHSSQITKLKNEIASVEKTAKLYFQMYQEERGVNQVSMLKCISLNYFRMLMMKNQDFLLSSNVNK